MTNIALAASNLRVSFGAVVAVNDVSFEVRAGELHALIGPNGAGKTTCFNALCGFVPLRSGKVLLNGEDMSDLPPERRALRGMVRSFQISSVFPRLSVVQNIAAALQSKSGQVYTFWASDSAMRPLLEAAHGIADRFGLGASANVAAAALPYGRKRALELATTIALDPAVVLLDEPMAGMTEEDIVLTTELVRQAAQGRTVLMVEHHLKVVETLCNRITVMAFGNVIASGSYDDVSQDKEVQRAYLGRRKS